MTSIHMTEAEFTSDLAAAMRKVELGMEILIEGEHRTLAILTPPKPFTRSIEDAMALMSDNCPGVDPDFEKDVRAVVESHPEPLDGSRWD